MKFKLTDHALQRYVSRINPNLTIERAQELILSNIENTVKLKEKTRAGDTIWESVELNCRFITRPERFSKYTNAPHICVTTIPLKRDEQYFQNLNPEILDKLIDNVEIEITNLKKVGEHCRNNNIKTTTEHNSDLNCLQEERSALKKDREFLQSKVLTSKNELIRRAKKLLLEAKTKLNDNCLDQSINEFLEDCGAI